MVKKIEARFVCSFECSYNSAVPCPYSYHER